MKILGLHIRDTKNAGDRASSPLDYFRFDADVEIADMRSPPDVRPDLVIYGGGSIIASPDFKQWGDAPVVAWGVGHHERKRPWAEEMRIAHRKAAAICRLYFPRDKVGFETVPCASCMHAAFDRPPAPTRDFVRYSAARRVEVTEPWEAPHMSNEDGSIEEAVAFLASARTVVTSSYHGAYWAGLLGRRVQLVTWGSKFDYLPRLNLVRCRGANRYAFRLVSELLGG